MFGVDCEFLKTPSRKQTLLEEDSSLINHQSEILNSSHQNKCFLSINVDKHIQMLNPMLKLVNDVFDEHDSSFVLVMGSYGCGKTTFMNKIIEQHEDECVVMNPGTTFYDENENKPIWLFDECSDLSFLDEIDGDDKHIVVFTNRTPSPKEICGVFV